jgi:hypothetical protein
MAFRIQLNQSCWAFRGVGSTSAGRATAAWQSGCKVLYRYVAKALARRGSSPPVMRRRY